MKTRFTINEKGFLEDRNGNVLGQVDGLTLKHDASLFSSGSSRGRGLSSSHSVERQNDLTTDPDPNPTLTEMVGTVFEKWLLIAAPRNTNLTPSRDRIIRKALKEATIPECLLALDGLVAWRAERGGNLELSRVFGTRPGGSPLREQMDFFISQVAEGEVALQTQAITPDEMVKINRWKDTVTQTYDKPHRREDFLAAVDKLQEKGWRVEPGNPPTFIAP